MTRWLRIATVVLLVVNCAGQYLILRRTVHEDATEGAVVLQPWPGNLSKQGWWNPRYAISGVQENILIGRRAYRMRDLMGRPL